MKTSSILTVALFLFLVSCQTSQEKQTQTQQKSPNVLFIIVDDLNDWVGYLNGHPQAYTPNIDRLAASGMAFANAHTNSPLCGPSRACLMTGKRPSTSGVYFHIPDKKLAAHREENMPEATFLPDYFEIHGYTTLGVGKIYHQGDAAGTYDEYGGLSNFGPKPEKRFEYDPEWFDKPAGTSTDWGAYPEHDTLTYDHRIASWAVDKLSRQHEKPFLLTVGFMRPHVPWYAPAHWYEDFPHGAVAKPPYEPDDWKDLPEMAEKVTDLPMMPEMNWVQENQHWEDMVRAYLTCVMFVDHQIGRVLDALENSAYADNTLIVLTSDHGYHLGEKGLFQKSTLWERSTHVPMIFSGLGIEAGQTSEPASLLDIYPTLVNFCGLEENSALEGKSLKPVIMQETASMDNYALTTYGFQNHSVQKGKWHYIRYNDGSEELYDLEVDSNEWQNLAADSLMASAKAKLSALLPKTNRPNIPDSYLGSTPYFAGDR